MIIRVILKGKEVKLTKKEYLRQFSEKQNKTPYNDKMIRSNTTGIITK